VEGGLPAEKVSVKPNFVYPDPGSAAGAGEYAVYVGRLSFEKGLPTLLSAWKRLPQSVPLLIVGDGPSRQNLMEQAEKDGLTSIKFCGRVARQQVFAIIKRARFLVFPSECYENFPGAIAEAFACGVPALASALGAMQELVDDGNTGLLFRPSDPADLSEKVAWAWSHAEALREMGRAARLKYETQYTAERNYRMLMTIYREARTARSSSHPSPNTVPTPVET
jgi:glycosyltransferase involved in cell wall biosynthesis